MRRFAFRSRLGGSLYRRNNMTFSSRRTNCVLTGNPAMINRKNPAQHQAEWSVGSTRGFSSLPCLFPAKIAHNPPPLQSNDIPARSRDPKSPRTHRSPPINSCQALRSSIQSIAALPAPARPMWDGNSRSRCTRDADTDSPSSSFSQSRDQ